MSASRPCSDAPVRSAPAGHRILAYVALAVVLLAPGCGRSSQTDANTTTPGGQNAQDDRRETPEEIRERIERAKREAAKPELELLAITTRPTDAAVTAPQIKPGHWTAAGLDAIANHDDFRGQLFMEPVNLEQSSFAISTTRPAILPKGQRKSLPLTVFLPPSVTRTGVGTRLRGDNREARAFNPMIRLDTHQYFFCVLCQEPERYLFLKDLDSFTPPTSGFLAAGTESLYRVVMPTLKTGNTPLPPHALLWTSTAYVLWDDVDVAMFNDEQKVALVDWLHWGGQLILCGPQTVEGLRGTFLEPYLPVSSSGTTSLAKRVVEQTLNAQYTPRDNQQFEAAGDWTVAQFDVAKDATVLTQSGNVELVVERRVGRGRVVACAFGLGRKDLSVWPDFDGFWNACLLRRPARRFFDDQGMTSVRWLNGTQTMYDARRVTSLRYFSRDMGSENGGQRNLSATALPLDQTTSAQVDLVLASGSGVAGWDDKNEVTLTAAQVLRNAAGLEAPPRSFVGQMLVVYLIILVPVNWAVCRSLGRVELAWLAAPVITLLFAVAVVKLAALNIGFARSITEVGVVELQPGYNRAHVTRYAALYTSLGTDYDLTFDDDPGVALPLDVREAREGTRRRIVDYRGDSGARLNDVWVSSNSLGMVHAEHHLLLTGTCRLEQTPTGGWQIVNGTELALTEAAVIGPQGIAVVGELPPGEAAAIAFRSGQQPLPAWLAEPELVSGEPASTQPLAAQHDTIELHAMAQLAAASRGERETRLIAICHDALPGMSIEPQADQRRQAHLIVAHLDYGPLPVVMLDSPTRSEVEPEPPFQDEPPVR